MKPLGLELQVGYGPQCERFVSPIPTRWYLKGLKNPTPTPADPMQAQSEPLEYRYSRVGACVGHIDFMLLVLISLAFGSQHEHHF